MSVNRYQHVVGAGRRMAQDPLRRKIKRDQILEHLAKLLSAKRNLRSMTLDEIAADLGSSKSTIYYYFNSKSDMLYDFYTYAYELHEVHVSSILNDNSKPARARLESAIRAQILLVCSRWQLWRVLWRDIGLQEISAGKARVIIGRRRLFHKQLLAAIKEAMDNDHLDCIDPNVVALTIAGMAVGIARWYNPKGTLSPDEIADFVIHSVFNGMLTVRDK